MNKRQRDANRATAFMARWALQRPRQSFGGTAGSGSMVILSSSDFTRGSTARPTFVCYDDMEGSTALTVADLPVDLRSTIFGVRDEAPRTIPRLTEDEGDMLRFIDGQWASAVFDAPKQIEFVNVMINPGWGTE